MLVCEFFYIPVSRAVICYYRGNSYAGIYDNIHATDGLYLDADSAFDGVSVFVEDEVAGAAFYGTNRRAVSKRECAFERLCGYLGHIFTEGFKRIGKACEESACFGRADSVEGCCGFFTNEPVFII